MFGKPLANYEIVDRLGEGGMGAVCLAKDTKRGAKWGSRSCPTTLQRTPSAWAR